MCYITFDEAKYSREDDLTVWVCFSNFYHLIPLFYAFFLLNLDIDYLKMGEDIEMKDDSSTAASTTEKSRSELEKLSYEG